MNPPDFSRLHALRMENDDTRFRMDEMRHRFEAYRTRHEDGTAPRAVSTWQLFQTPSDVARRMVELSDCRPGDLALEPSAGLGRIVDPLLEAGASVVAVEAAAECAAELFTKYDGEPVALYQRDFLTFEHPRKFDCVVMNPPFHMRADVAHIWHALEMLKPGGVLVALAMATRHRETLADGAGGYSVEHWERLGAETFAREGTRVETFLMKLRKH